MEIVLTDCEHIFRPQSRGGLPVTYSIGTITVTANSQDEIWQMVRSMQAWANGTFQPVVMERPDPNGPLIVSPVKEPKDPELEDIEIDPITGIPQ